MATAADGMDPLARTKSGEMSNPSSMGMDHGAGMTNSSANTQGILAGAVIATHKWSGKRRHNSMATVHNTSHTNTPSWAVIGISEFALETFQRSHDGLSVTVLSPISRYARQRNNT